MDTPQGEEIAGQRHLRFLDLWPYALIAFLFLATSPFHQGLNNPNEMTRVYMTRALVEYQTPAIERVINEWGGVDDKAVRNGHLYSSKAPFQSLIGVPAYEAAKPLLRFLGLTPNKRMITTVLRILASVSFGIAFASLLLAYARRRSVELGAPRPLGTALGLALALGTMIYPYAITFTGHLLAAFAAGGAFLATIELSREREGSTRYRNIALLAGLGAGISPFAEYPAALVAGPALIGSLVHASNLKRKLELALLFIGGALPPFLLGLWAHHDSWGSPFKTGYAFLENSAYHELHGEGFFGVSLPKIEAFLGALFSPGTGLFFFSPFLIIGLAALLSRLLKRNDGELAIPHALAISSFVGVVLSILFISAHRGWRGGWTLGPRYIISLAPVLGIWTIEALAIAKVRSFVAALGAVSIVTTGFAAALYPHLSDVFVNPLKTFVLPSYLLGASSYGIGHAFQLSGSTSNLVHVVPLIFATAYVALSGVTESESIRRRASIVVGTFVAVLGLVAIVPEPDPVRAENENHRLWGFWEPSIPKDRLEKANPESKRTEPTELEHGSVGGWRSVRVLSLSGNEVARPCIPEGDRCRYGDDGWQHFGPETLEFDGESRRVLFLHPIAQHVVQAEFRTKLSVKRAVFSYGLSDSAVASANKDPVRFVLRRGTNRLGEGTAGNKRGFHRLELALSSTTSPLVLELTCDSDGARVFGFDLELYED